MADFLFCRERHPEGYLANLLFCRYPQGLAPATHEYHGEWGSLAVTNNPYSGFLPYETPTTITAVVGGPALRIASNDFLMQTDSNEATRIIHDRAQSLSLPPWQNDLDGPYALIQINKQSGSVTVTTDLLLFIPVYRAGRSTSLVIGTHVDAVAEASGNAKHIDPVSVADYVFHGAITFPHTLYAPVIQLAPGSAHTFTNKDHPDVLTYWSPTESQPFGSVEEAADELTAALQSYIAAVTGPMAMIGCFLSGGEDSRFVLGLAPNRLNTTAITFHQLKTREYRIAKACATGYGVTFRPVQRPRSYHADNFSAVSRLIGAGAEPKHAQVFGEQLIKDSVRDFPAVFGGFLSDTLLKGNNIKTLRMLPFLPALQRPLVSADRLVTSGKFNDELCYAVRSRRNDHLAAVENNRPDSAMEWSLLWPVSMMPIMAGYHASRRLFRTYEPFMSSSVVKVSARIPQKWKYNRDVFHRAAKPFYEPVKWLPHEDGRVPYFSPNNILIHGVSWLTTEAERLKSKHHARKTGSVPNQAITEWAPLLASFHSAVPDLWKQLGLSSPEAVRSWNGKYQLRLLQSIALHQR